MLDLSCRFDGHVRAPGSNLEVVSVLLRRIDVETGWIGCVDWSDEDRDCVLRLHGVVRSSQRLLKAALLYVSRGLVVLPLLHSCQDKVEFYAEWIVSDCHRKEKIESWTEKKLNASVANKH